MRAPTTVITNGQLTGDAAGYFYTQPLPAADLPGLDPFLLLHHHGPLQLPPDNAGMPFGPHPHRGFETLTVILEGSVVHHDSRGQRGRIDRGGAQWMTAGRGLIHNESTPRDFNEQGGALELLQLWINLPARLKLMPPHYEGIGAERVPTLAADPTLPGATVRLFTGHWRGQAGAYQTPTGITAGLLTLPAGAGLTLPAPPVQTVLLYVLRGKPTVSERPAKPRTLVAFDATTPAADDEIALQGDPSAESLLFYCAGEPLREPVVQHGPFVMNTQTQIMGAMRDYQMGRMGVYIEE